jgi:hypothetical protein
LPPINGELLKGEQKRKRKFNSIVNILYSCGFCSVLFFLKCISKEHSFDKNMYFNRNWSEKGREKWDRQRVRETETEREKKEE